MLTTPLRLAALALALTLPAVRATAAFAEEGHKAAVVVTPIEMFDESADQRPFVIEAQRRWMQDAEQEFRQTLSQSDRVRIVDDATTKAALARLAGEYAHPSSCHSCLTALAGKSGARFVATETVHKVSDLIIYLGGELDDTATGRVLMSDMLEVKADNDVMLKRAGQALAHDLITHLPD